MLAQILDTSSNLTVIRPGTNNIIDSSNTGPGNGIIAIRPTIECYARMTKEIGNIGLNSANVAGRGISLLASEAPGGTAAGLAGTSLDFGTNNIACEKWFTLEQQNSGDTVFDLFGNTTGAVQFNFQVNTSGSLIEIEFRIRTNSAASTLIDYSNFTVDLKPVIGERSQRPVHITWFLKRTGNASGLFKVWCNQILLQSFTYNDTASAAQGIDISSGGAATSLNIGCNSSLLTAGNPGRAYATRFYNMGSSDFTDAMVLHRNKLGPDNLPTDGFLPSWRLNFQDQASWTNPNFPEAYNAANSIVTTFNALRGSLSTGNLQNLSNFSAGRFSSTVNGIRCPANTSTFVKKTLGKQFISLYASPPSSGEVLVIGAESF